MVANFSVLSSNALPKRWVGIGLARVCAPAIHSVNRKAKRWCRMLQRNFQYLEWDMFHLSEPCLPSFPRKKILRE